MIFLLTLSVIYGIVMSERVIIMIFEIEKIAELYNVPKRRARDWIRKGVIPFVRLPHTRKYMLLSQYKLQQELCNLTPEQMKNFDFDMKPFELLESLLERRKR